MRNTTKETMKLGTTAAWLLFLSAVACGKPAAPPEPADPIEDTATEDADSAAEDAASQQPDGAVVAQDTGVGAQADADGDVDSDAAIDGGDGWEKLPPPAAPSASPMPHCATMTDPGLPKPGQPCKVLGARRCTDLAMFSSKPWMEFSKLDGPKTGFCIRPNLVRCELVDGQLRWAAHACPKPDGADGCSIANFPMQCVEDELSVRCCPVACFHDKQMRQPPVGHPHYGNSYLATPCQPEEKGHTRCGFDLGHTTYRCGRQDEFADIADATQYMFHTCNKLCSGCRYWFRTAYCPDYTCKLHKDDLGKCAQKPPPPGCDQPHDTYEKYGAQCVKQPGGGVACQKSCEEMGLVTP